MSGPQTEHRFRAMNGGCPELIRARFRYNESPFMRFFIKRALWLIATLVLSVSAPAQLLQQLINSSTASQAAQTPQDALGRDTPNGTVFGFLQAAQSHNDAVAVQYLQLSPGKHPAQTQELATQLKEVLDNAFKGSVRRISISPDGNPQEGVAP